MNARMTRVCHLVTALDYGGVERQARILAEVAAKRNGHLHFLAIGGGGTAAEHIAPLGHGVTCLQAKTSVRSPATFLAVLRAIRRIRPYVIHTHGAEANAHGLPAAFLAGVPVRIGEEIGLPNHSRSGRLVFRWIYRFAHRVVAVSALVADDLVSSGEVTPDRIVVIEHPVQPVAPVSAEDRHGHIRPRCCFVGRLVESKNVAAVIDALGELASRGRPFDLWIIGEGPERQALEALARARSLDPYVTFLGFRDRPEDFVRSCDLFVMPSLHEGYCLALVEAMAMGVPAVTTSVGIAPEVIEDGVSGWLVPAGGSAAFARKLEHVLSLPLETRATVGTAGRQRVLERSSPEAYVRRLDELYEAEWRRRAAGMSG